LLPEHESTRKRIYCIFYSINKIAGIIQEKRSDIYTYVRNHPESRMHVFIIAVFFCSRILYVVDTLIASLLPIASLKPASSPFWTMWDQWDTPFYIAIAANGYAPVTPHAATYPAFFPLYPLCIRLTAPLFGNNYYLASLFVTNICWLIALYGIAYLGCHLFSERVAMGAVLMLTVFPSAIYGFVPYPHALFLALAIYAYIAMRHQSWFVAAILGMLASLTRQLGVLLVIPFLLEYLKRCQWNWRAIRVNILAVAIIPCGTLIYMALLWRVTGNPFQFLMAQGFWNRVPVFPLVPLWQGLLMLPDPQQADYLSFFSVIGMIALTVVAWRRLPTSASILATVQLPLYLLTVYPGAVLLSQARFMLEIFPLFIVFGELATRRRWVLIVILITCTLLQLVLLAKFARGGWVQ
jgi:Dolichyl-phosphate-mannose-protein mannosyltransferase